MTFKAKLPALCLSLLIAGELRASDRPITTLVPSDALVVYTAFQIRDSSVKGFLVIVLSVASLDRLIQEVDVWEAQQGR